MTIRSDHRQFTVCPASLAKVGRCLIFLLLMLPLRVAAQEETDSVPDAGTTATVQDVNEDKSPVRVITFTPEQAQHQKRYNPRTLDSLFTKVWWKRFYGGIGAGVMGMTDNVGKASTTNFEAYLGYRFSPVNSLRMHFNLTPYRYADGFTGPMGVGVGVDYMANLTNYVLGNSRTRYFDAGIFFGAGLKFLGEGMPDKINPYFRMGAHGELHLSKRVALFVEPYVGLHKQTSDLFERPNPEKFNLMYGLNAGLQLALDERGDYFVSADTTYRDVFFDFASGISLPGRAGGLMHRAGLSYQLGVGQWINPMMGFRLSAQAESYYWNVATPYMHGIPARTSRAQTLFSGRLELIMSPLNFIPAWRQKEEHIFDLNVLLGGDIGWNIKGHVPNAPNGFHCYYYGFTGAVQGLYRINKSGTYLYLEPRFLSAMYHIPYANTDNSLFVADKSVALSLGTRVYMTNPGTNTKSRGTFIPNWWIGADFGGVRLQHNYALHPEGSSSFNPMASLALGFEWKPYVAFRATASYQRLAESMESAYYGIDKNGEQVSGKYLWNNRYNMLDVRLAYMLNLNNLLQGYDNVRRFNVWLTAGPSLSMVMNETNTLAPGQVPEMPELEQMMVDGKRAGRVSPGLAASMMASMEVVRNLDVTLEALGQYNFISGVNPGTGSNANNLKYGFAVGTRYHVSHRAVRNFFKGEFADPWQRGWQVEVSGGWVLPVNANDPLRCGGSNMSLGVGYWWNNLLGARFALGVQQNYWNKTEVQGQREPISGVYLHTPYTEFKTEMSVGGRVELMLNPLNFFKFRQFRERAPKWDMNISAGINFGAMRKEPYVNSGYVGLTAAMAGLYRLSPLAQVFVEPRFDLYNYSRFNSALQAKQSFSDRSFSLSFGTRISRPLASTDNERKGRVRSQMAYRGFWLGVNVGGSKAIQGLRATKKSFSFAPSFGATVGYNFDRLNTVRAQVAYENFSGLRVAQPYNVITAGLHRTFYGTMETSFSQLDARFLYMLNMSNLWTGYDRRVPFNLYLQGGLAVSSILSESVELAEGEVLGGTDFTYAGESYGGKIGAGLAAGALAAYSIDRHWDVTAEMLGQYYLGGNYMPHNSDSPFNGFKLHFSAGIRYKF